MIEKPAQLPGYAFGILRIAAQSVSGLDEDFSPVWQVRYQEGQSASQIIKWLIRSTSHCFFVVVVRLKGHER